ncbi:integrase core domain-containing protein [Streptomyces globisporus]|uniref:integrase core domain-containing protein n=1 Tax=Streptomyces globisporus TaxID=1908 RepID=UPI0036FB44F7
MIKKGSDLIRHSDREARYVSIRYIDRLADIGAFASVGSGTVSYDNAMAEALNCISKAELIETQHPWKDVDQVIRAIFQWITWYNGERLHSALDYVPPAEYEGACRRSKEQIPQSAWTKTTGLYETRGSSGCAAGVSGRELTGHVGLLSVASGRIRFTDATTTWRRPVGEEDSGA